MRLLSVLLCVLLSGSSAIRGNAAPDAPPTNAAVYAEAVSNLRHGHDYARCVQQLQYLVGQNNASREYHLALGCAEADRAVSLGYAALWTKMLDDEHAHYSQSVADWQAAQRDPKSDTYGDPRPTLPPVRTFITKDDFHPFLMPISEAIVQINALARDAQAQWKQALELSPTPKLRAETENVQGWGLQEISLLSSSGVNDNGTALKGLLPLPTQTEVVRAFTVATHDAPTSAAYWQGLGDAQYAVTKDDKNVSRPDALLAYKKSLALQPKNAPLWLRVYRMTLNGNTNNGKADPQNAPAALKHVIDSDPGNAYPRYLLATLLFKQTHYSDLHDKSEKSDQTAALTAEYDAAQQDAANTALTEIERGTSCPRYEHPTYQPPYPALLTGFGIWENLMRLSDMDWADNPKLRELARACGGYARIAAAHGDALGLQRGARAAIGMGMKIAGDWPAQDKEPGDGSVIPVLVGIAVSAIGYSDLVKGEGQIGDTPAMQQVQAEFDAFLQRTKAYKAAAKQNMDAISTYDYY